MAQSLVKLTLESNQYERNLRNAQKQLNDFTRSIGINMKSLSGMALAAGAVTGAMKVAKDAFFANEKQLDEWGRSVEASKSLYNGFLNALNNSDISGYLSNINNIVEAARAAYDALDELNTFNAFNQVNVEKTRTGMTEAIAGYRMGESSKENVQAAAAAYKKELEQRQELEREAYSQAIRKIAAERGVSWGGLEQALSGNYGSYKQLKEIMPTGKRIAYMSAGQYGGTLSYEIPMAVTAEEKMGEALRALNDTELQSLQALGAQAERTGNEIANIDKQVARILNGKGSSGESAVKVSSGRSTGTKTEKTEEQLINENIQKLTQEYIKASNERQAAIRNEIKGLQDQLAVIRQLKDEALGKTTMPIVGMRGLAESPVGISTENPFEKYKDASFELVTPLQQLEKELLTIQELQAKAWSPEVFAAYQKRVEEVQGKIDTFKGIKKDADTSAKSFNDAAQSIASVGSALQSLEDPGAKIAGIIGEAVAQIALGFAQATAADSKFGVFGWIAAITGGMATMISTISAIHSATGYAQGGIVEGRSYSGDNIPILANAGEVVLTRAMQNNLATQLQGGEFGNMNLTATISGEQIRLALNNNGRRTGRGEYVTTTFKQW